MLNNLGVVYHLVEASNQSKWEHSGYPDSPSKNHPYLAQKLESHSERRQKTRILLVPATGATTLKWCPGNSVPRAPTVTVCKMVVKQKAF